MQQTETGSHLGQKTKHLKYFASTIIDKIEDCISAIIYMLGFSSLGAFTTYFYAKALGLERSNGTFHDYDFKEVGKKTGGVNPGYFGENDHQKYMVKSGPPSDLIAEILASAVYAEIKKHSNHSGAGTPEIFPVLHRSELWVASSDVTKDSVALTKTQLEEPRNEIYFEAYNKCFNLNTTEAIDSDVMAHRMQMKQKEIDIFVGCEATMETDCNPGNILYIFCTNDLNQPLLIDICKIDHGKAFGLEKRHLHEKFYNLTPAQLQDNEYKPLIFAKFSHLYDNRGIIAREIIKKYISLSIAAPLGFTALHFRKSQLENLLCNLEARLQALKNHYAGEQTLDQSTIINTGDTDYAITMHELINDTIASEMEKHIKERRKLLNDNRLSLVKESPVPLITVAFSTASFFLINNFLSNALYNYISCPIIGLATQIWRNSAYDINLYATNHIDLIVGLSSGIATASIAHFTQFICQTYLPTDMLSLYEPVAIASAIVLAILICTGINHLGNTQQIKLT